MSDDDAKIRPETEALYQEAHRDMARIFDDLRRKFEKTGNPMHAWQAWLEFRHAQGVSAQLKHFDAPELPQWLGAYFDACMYRLFGQQPELGEDGRPVVETCPPDRREGPRAVGRAMGFPTGLAVAREQWGGPFDEREKLALRAVVLMRTEGLSLGAASEKLKGAGAGSSTIRRAVEGARGTAQKCMQAELHFAVRDGLWDPSAPDVPTHKEYSNLCQHLGPDFQNGDADLTD